MSYGLKYIMQWASQNANANDYRIELYQKDYSGEVTEKKLGSAPSLVIDNAGNGIMGTSLQFSIQADTDGELNDLYTTDSKMYKVMLYRNEAVVWNGYMLQELYSEEYIAPPYDVDVTATDQLALLKDEAYNPLGRVSLLRIIDNALTATQLDLGYAIQSSLKPVVQDSGTFLDYITVDDRGFADKTAYEVLEGVLSTLNMTICQQDNRWYLIRRNDVNAPIYIYGSDLGYLGLEDPVAAQIGQMYVNRIYPIGNLMLTKQAAKKGAKFNYTPILPLSILEDPNTVGKDKWNYNADYIRSYPAVEVNYRGSYIKAKVDAFTLVSTKLMVKDYALWQALDVEASEQALKLEVAYLGLVTAAYNAFQPTPSVTVKLTVQIKIEGDGQTYYLTQQGWSEEDAEDIGFTGNWLQNSISAKANKDNYNTATIEFPGFPISGKFTISFRNDSTITSSRPPGNNRVDLAVSNVYVTMPEIQGYNSNVLANPNAAQTGPEQVLLFSDAYQVANEKSLHYNYILYPSGDVVSEWELAGEKYESFYQAMIQDISNSIGNVVNRFSGVIAGEGLFSPVYLEKFSSSVMRLGKGTYDLVQEELSGEWIEVPSNAVEVGEYEVLTNDGQRVSVGSATDSKVPTGNFASAAAFEQLTKIVNILNTIIGLDDDDNAYVKPKSDGTPRNFYTYGTMSFGGIDDGESGEGGGMGITSLYDIPEIAVSANLADGQSLVYDATLDKWVNRLVQGGSGVDMDYIWAALAGGTDEKINVSHIPDLSELYLPLTGGIMTGDLKFANGVGIKAVDIHKNLQIGMYQNNGIFLQGPRLLYSTASGSDYQIWHEGNLPDTTWVKNSGGIKATDTYLRHAGYGYLADGWGTTGPAIAFGASNGYTMLMQQGASSHVLYVSYKTSDGTIRDWKRIAFTDEPSFAKYLGSFNGDANTISDGFIGGKLSGAANFPYNYYSFISAGYGNYKLQFNGYNNNLQFRCGSESGLDNKEWRTVAFTDSTIANADKLDGLDETRFFRRRSILRSYDSQSALSLGLYMLGNAESETDYFPTGNGTFINLTSTDDSDAVGTNYGLQFCANFAADALYVRSVWYNSLKSWKQLAYVTSNVNSATKLQTARKIWGRTFNGTSDITSHLELGNSIAIKVTDNGNTLRNALVMDSYNSLLIGSENVASDAGYMTHIYGKPIRFSISSDNHPVTITSNANVLIGTTTENIAYKLNVVGAARISDTLNLGAGVQIGNNALVSFRSKVTETEIEAKYYSGLYLSPANNFQIGYGTATSGKFKTNLHGYGIDFRSKGNDSATMSLTTGGNVGIGITNPEYKLDVNGTTRLNGKVTLTKDVVLNNYTAIKFKDFDGVELNTIMVGTDNALTIGADHSVKNYETRIKGVGVTLFNGGTQVLSLTSASKISAKNILPFADDNPYNLGSSNNRWKYIYCYNLDAATRITMQVPDYTYPHAKIIRDTSTGKVYYQAGLVDGSAKQGKMGISGIDATKLVSLDINSTLTTISDKLVVGASAEFYTDCLLQVKGAIGTNSYISFGYYGKQLTEDPTSTFRTAMFGDAVANSRLRTFRANEAFGLVAAKYGAGLAWSTADTHAYINVDHMSSEIVYIGGGNADKLNWQARLYTSKMSLIPDSTGTYNLGSSDNRWNTIYGTSLNLSGGISSGNIMPLANNTYNLGTRDIRWGVLYAYYGSFTNGVNTQHYYTLDGTIRAFNSNNSYLEIGGGYVSNDLPVYINGRPLMFRASNTTDLTIGADGIAIFSKMSRHDAGIKIGEATLVWDAVNQCLVVDKNFVSDGSISFGGLEPPTEDDYLATNGGTILGDLGIGNAANTYKNLNMYGSMYFYLNSNPTAYKMQLWMDGNSRLALRNPTDHAATKFYVYGDIIYNGTCGKPSDMRLKHVVEDVCLSSEIIAKAPLFRYKRKDSEDDRVYIGSSAQYWQKVAPELTPLVDDYLTLDYETLGVMMGKSNATEIELLKERMKILEAKVENYERILGII